MFDGQERFQIIFALMQFFLHPQDASGRGNRRLRISPLFLFNINAALRDKPHPGQKEF